MTAIDLAPAIAAGERALTAASAGRPWAEVSRTVVEAAATLIEAAVREKASEEILRIARELRMPRRDDEDRTAHTLRIVRASVLSDAARIARNGAPS